jgi:hypothetical protein
MKPNFRISCGQSLGVSLAALIVCSGFVTTPATAGGGDVAAGLLGGLAVGAVMGSAVAQPRYYAPYYYAPAPVYVPAPRCWFEHERLWDGYGYVIERIRVCE